MIHSINLQTVELKAEDVAGAAATAVATATASSCPVIGKRVLMPSSDLVPNLSTLAVN